MKDSKRDDEPFTDIALNVKPEFVNTVNALMGPFGREPVKMAPNSSQEAPLLPEFYPEGERGLIHNNF